MDLLPIVIVGSVCSLWLAWELGRKDADRKVDERE
jgi:hypothetical protein